MKNLLLIMLVLIGTGAVSQRPSISAERIQRWKELNLSQQQKEQIRALIVRQRKEQLRDIAELNKILSTEQKRKVKKWQRDKKPLRKKK